MEEFQSFFSPGALSVLGGISPADLEEPLSDHEVPSGLDEVNLEEEDEIQRLLDKNRNKNSFRSTKS